MRGAGVARVRIMLDARENTCARAFIRYLDQEMRAGTRGRREPKASGGGWVEC